MLWEHAHSKQDSCMCFINNLNGSVASRSIKGEDHNNVEFWYREHLKTSIKKNTSIKLGIVGQNTCKQPGPNINQQFSAPFIPRTKHL